MENETWLQLIFWIGTLMMLLLVLLILTITVAYQKKVDRIKRKESENQLSVSLESEKKERKRIASDLHDGISGDLNAMRNFVSILEHKETDEYSKTILKEIKQALNQTLVSVQNISYNLMPPTLETLGLVATLKDYFERVRKWNTQTLIIEQYDSEVPLSVSDGYEIYRVVQEIITNLIKHGKATRIVISLSAKSYGTVLMIEDNGRPFDYYKSIKTSKGMGLKNIKSRIQHIGGILLQESDEKANRFKIVLK